MAGADGVWERAVSAPHSRPLPPALRGTKAALSEAGRKQLEALNRRSSSAFVFELLTAWTVIAAAIAAATIAQHWWVSVAAIVVVATRQGVLALLIHEQAHCLAFRSRPGDVFVNLVAAYPLLVVTVEDYAQVHLAHHRFFFTEKDPDLLRKSGPEWTCPMPRRQLLQLLLTDLFGLNLITLIKGKRPAEGATTSRRPRQIPGWVRPAYFVALVALLTGTGAWMTFLLYWVVPLLTVFQVVVRIGALCEHQYIPGEGVIETSPLIEVSWWEQLILPNLNFNLHAYHHWFPGIPFHLLPTAHDIFRREGLVDDANVFKGYRAYFHYIVTGVPRPAAGPGSEARRRF